MSDYDQYVPANTKAAAAPTGGNEYDRFIPSKGGPIGHVSTPFADPARKPMFDTSGLDARIQGQIDAQNNAAGTTTSAVGRALSYPQAAVSSALTRGMPNAAADPMDALRHRISPQLAELYDRPAKPGMEWINHAGKGLIDAGIQMGTDPLTYLGVAPGGRSLIARGGEALEQHLFPAVVKAGGAIDKAGPVGKAVTSTVAAAHDFLGVQSAAKRELARLHGSAWLDKYADYRARLMQMGGKPDPALEAQAVVEAKAPPSGPVPNIMPKKKLGPSDFIMDPKTGQPVLKSQASVPLGPATVGAGARGGVDRATARVGRQAPKLGAIPAEKPEPKFSDEDQRIFDLMAHPGGVGGLKLPGPLNTAQDIFTSGLFVQPLGHQANITALGALADPLATGRAIARGVGDTAKQLVGKGESEASIAARHEAAKRGGAISSHATERSNPIVDMATAAIDGGKKYGVAGAIATAIPRAVRGLYKWSGDSLWKFDDEVKAQRFDSLVKGGLEPARAGLRVGGELVDYENKSPVGRALRPVAPFSTWRTKAPLAVARNVIENPGRAAAINRAAPAAFGGSQGNDPVTGKPYTSSLPMAELNELLTNPGKYALGSQGVVPRLAVDAGGALFGTQVKPGRGNAQERERKHLRTIDTYGQEPGTFALNSSPLVDNALDLTGGGMFQKGQRPTTLTDLLNLIRVHP